VQYKKYLPVLSWIRELTSSDIRCDILAGLTVWVLLIPQAMAYAFLAGMPPIYGLYAGFIPFLIYAILGTSKHLSVGPVAITSMLVLSGVSKIADPFSSEYISLVLLAGLLIGLVQFLAGLFRLGFLVNFLSHPVISGFTAAAAIIIIISQLPNLFGISTENTGNVLNGFISFINNLSSSHMATLIIGASSILLIFLLSKINNKIPGGFLVVMLGICAIYFTGLSNQGIELVGQVPKGLPTFIIPQFSVGTIQALLPTIFTVSIIGIIESVSIAKYWEQKIGTYKIHPNQEMRAIGFSKIIGAFFQAMPSSGSFSRTSVNSTSGAKSQLSSIVSFILVGLTLIFLTEVFVHLPKTILAAIIILSVRKLINFKEAIFLWRTYRPDFIVYILTFLLTLILGIEIGVFSGIFLSLAIMLYRNANPDITRLGKLPMSNVYKNIERYPEAIESEEHLILRFDNQIFFGNAVVFRDKIESLVVTSDQNLRLVVLAASNIHDIDSSGLRALEEVLFYLRNKDIEFYISGLIGPVRDTLYRSDYMEKIGEKNLFLLTHEAVEAFQKRAQHEEDTWSTKAAQSNYKKSDA